MDEVSEGGIRRFLVDRIASRCHLRVEQVDPDRPLEEFGLSSRDAVATAGELAELLGRELDPTLVWEYPTVNRLAAALTRPPEVTKDPGKPGEELVAVVGLGCRLPGAHGPEAFWRLLMDGRDAVTEVPEGRWELFDDGSARTAEVLARTTRHGGFLDDVAGFDAEFFGIAPGEAATMDPQQRILLETAWEALEHGGLAPRSLRGSRTGVFVGISGNEYAYLTTADATRVDAWTATGAASSIAANRLSYLLDLRGPSLAVDTACSSSLVATHLAVRSLRTGESDLALAAGVNLLLSPVVTMAFDQGGGTAPDGRCKAFDASADGMVRAEGCGVVVLKRLADAVRDGDRVLAVVRATGVNQDGRSNGLVAPNPEAQEALLREVYGGLDRGPDYIEAHGTGTFLGDPIEARAIVAALGPDVLIGSVKSNLGHLEAAAGVTGLIKATLALHHGMIPPSIHFRERNPHVKLEVVTEPTLWPRRDARAGVSSFGFGGTNAHVALDAFTPQPFTTQDGTAKRVFVLTDTTAERVRSFATKLAGWVPETEFGDVAHTLARRAGRGRVGAAVVASDVAELSTKLLSLTPEPVHQGAPVWVFSGYGAQWPGMGQTLYAQEPAFRAALDELAPLLRAEAGIELFDPAHSGVATVQPVIFAMQIALARLWTAYGVTPGAMIGHSMGEVAAAVVSGGIGLHDAVRIICRRARLLGTLGGGGAMAVLEVAAEEVPSDLHVAVYSSPTQTVVTGDPHRVARFAAEVEARGLFARTLTAEGAGHSPQVKPLLPLLREELAAIAPGKPGLPYYSTVLDDPREAPAFDPAYWAAGIRRPVRLMQAIRAAQDDGFTTFTEISPHPLLGLASHSLRRGNDAEFYQQLARTAPSIRLRTAGRVVDVPATPWKHDRHWVAPVHRTSGHTLLGAHVETAAGHAWTTLLDDLSDAPWRLPPEDWHRHGHPILPVTAVARLAWAAACEVYGETSLYNVVLHELLPLPAQVTVTLADGVIEVTAKDAAGVWHVYGSARMSDAQPYPEGLESIAHVGVDGTFGGIEVREIPAVAVPVRLDGKLVERVWVPAPLVDAGCETAGARGWFVLADEGDPRASRLAPGDDGMVVLVPTDLDPRRAEKLVVDIAHLTQQGRRLTIVTQDASSNPVAASLRGLVRVLALEHPEVRPRIVDVDTLDSLDLELAGDSDDDEVSWRDGTRYAARLTRADLTPTRPEPQLTRDSNDPSHPPARLTRDGNDRSRPLARLARAGLEFVHPAATGGLGKRGGVVGAGSYVITGGFGALGLVVARWLVDRGATRVVLNGRTAPADLGGLPAEVVVGDLADPGTVRRLVEVATADGVRLRGVVHAAGVLDDRLAAELDRESVARVWRAKVHGGLLLHEATRGMDLDWWVGFSSAAALLGSPGQAAYATANAFLDALCEQRGGISINWGAWQGANPMPAVEPLTLGEGIEALEALLQRGRSMGVVRLDPAVAAAVFPAVGRMPYFSLVADVAAEVVRDLSDLGPDEALAVIAAKVTERAAAVLGFDPVWLGEASVLTDLGLDSLAATRLRGTIEHDFGVTVPIAPLLKGGTLGALALLVAQELGIVGGVMAQTAIGPRDAAERQVVRVLTRVLGREPSVTERIEPEVLEVLLDLLSEELGRPLTMPGTPLSVPALDRTVPSVLERDHTVPSGVGADLTAPSGGGRDHTVASGVGVDHTARSGGGRDHTVASGVGVDHTARSGGGRDHTAASGVGEDRTVASGVGAGGSVVGVLVAEVADAVRAVDEGEAERGIVRGLSGGDGAPLFLAHPAGGTTGVYALLADRLGVPVFGLERVGEELGIVERAARYAGAIRQTCDGPYRLGGWSFGGILAFEIARQLGDVEVVVMIDSGLPDEVDPERRLEIQAQRYVDFSGYLRETYGVDVQLGLEELRELDEQGQLALTEERIAESGVLGMLSPAILRHQITSHEDTRAIEQYEAQPYLGRVVLFRSTEATPWAVEDVRYAHQDDPARGFGPYAPRLEVVPIEGAHHLNLLDPPYVEVIAGHLKGLL
ncbi:SDR family NAD(P)-dependent oxidoreductase [Nonomuraea sp. NPDC050556]|uniref:SDR family NAD(P)-dependent oxidoreductase n=1 Tax=Nonomuraea sp. NPDC050556 TaxID=3364369 RepID=UPI00378EDEAC